MQTLPVPVSFRDTYDEIDRRIRAGDFSGARRRLRKRGDELPTSRAQGPWIAELYRRAGLPDLAVRLLFRYVHPSAADAARIKATSHELAEYGGSLIRLYAIRDAERVLDRLPDSDPRKFYFLGFARIHEWDYAGALRYLKKYETFPPTSPYLTLVARVNLSDCLVETGDYSQAQEMLHSCLEMARKSDARLLEGNIRELIAKNFVYSGAPTEARASLLEARRFLGPGAAGTADDFFLEKLERVLELKSGTKEARLKTLALQTRAHHSGQFEVARDLDLYLAEMNRDQDRYDRLFYGTPFPAYQERISKSAESRDLRISTEYEWTPGGPASTPKSTRSDHSSFPPDLFKPGSLLQRLFFSLIADAYRPRRLSELHESVYSGQFFNPETSPDQIHQLFRRLRALLKKSAIRASIVESNGTYSLEGKVKVNLPPDLGGDRSFLKRLQLDHGAMSSREAADRIGCSKNTAISVLKRLVERKLIHTTGSGPRLRYGLFTSRKGTR